MHFTEIIKLAARAWHETKPAGDPEFNDCQLTHRENLGAAAKAVVDSKQAFTDFERAVLRLYTADQEAKSEADKILEENPTLHGDEVMHIASGVPHPLAGKPLAGHAENAQMAAVREEFKGVESDVFVANETEELKGPLPKDFPAHDLLHEAGINTYTQLLKVEDFTTIAGVGPATAEKITNRLAEESQKKEN